MENAALLWTDHEQRSTLGWTDARGEHGLEIASLGRGVLQAHKEGWWSERVYLDGPVPSPLVIRMLSEGRIEGVLLLPDGRPAGPGFTVLVWPSSFRFPPRSTSWRAMLGDPHCTAVGTDEFGAFRCGGLDPRLSYDVAAGGQGLLTSEPRRGVRAGTHDLRLRLALLFGVKTRVVEEGADRLPISTHLAADVLFGYRLLPQDDGLRKVPGWLAPLSGVLPVEADLPPFSALLFYTARDARDSVGPILFQGSVPGFVPRTLRFFAWPVSSGLQEERIELVPLVRRRGSLKVSFVGPEGADGWPDNRVQPLVNVHLHDAAGDSMEYWLRGFTNGERLIEDLPAGSYSVGVASRSSPIALPLGGDRGRRVTIEEGAVAAITVRTDGLGSIRAEILDGLGVAYRGPAVLTFLPVDVANGRPLSSGTLFEVDFRHGPYCLGGLGPGRYRLAFRFPRAYAPDPIDHQGVEVRAGQRTDVAFSLVSDG